MGGKLAFRVLCSQAAWHSENSVLGKLAAKGLNLSPVGPSFICTAVKGNLLVSALC